MKIEDRIKAKKELVEKELKRILAEPKGKLVHSMKYSVLSGGKRFRPILTLATGECFGCDDKTVLPFACALELIHNYSLIHDDLPAMDNDDFRRGQPSCHKAFGEDVAILAGDALLTLAFEVLSTSPVKKGQEGIINKVIKEVSRSAGISGMIGGQYLDIKLSAAQYDWEDYHSLVLQKTGGLIIASVRTGALLGQASPEEMKAVTDYAKNLGFAFQIRDDILDSNEDIQDGKMVNPNEVFFHGPKGARKELFKYVNSAVRALDNHSIKSEELRYLALKLLEVKKNNGKSKYS